MGAKANVEEVNLLSIWQMHSEFPEGCREAASTTEEMKNADYCCTSNFQNSPQLSTVSTMSDSPVLKFVYWRKKVQRNSLANSSVQAGGSTTKSEGACHSIVISDAPSVGVPGQCKASEDTASTMRCGWDYLSTVGSDSPFAVGEQHVVSKLVYERRKLQRNSAANSLVQASASTTKSEVACPSIVISDAPSAGVPEQSKASQDTASTKRSGWDCLSTVVFDAPFAVGEQHVVSKFVYGRRKLQRYPIVTSSGQAAASTKRNGGDCLSVVSSDAPGIVGEQGRVSEAVDDAKGVGDALIPLMVCNGGADALKSDLINGCSFSDELCPNEASEKCRQRANEVDCANESCSSSRSDTEAVTATMKTELRAGECSSSRALIVEAIEANLLGKDHCNSKLKGSGVCERVCSSRSHASAKDVSSNNASSSSQSCKICGHTETTLKMLVCDNCEEAFHVSCCNPRIKKVPTYDWFCSSCLKHKHSILKETISRKTANIIGEKGKSSSASVMGESNPIELMLRDTEPYTTAVQIGKGFQAEVSDWSGPINDDPNVAGEPLEVDSRDINVHEMKSNEPSTLGSICNWLQCREVDVGNGNICGKWRRAPLFEVQTDDWECFYSVFWDPSHADCAAPQELETDRVMKQLKCIRMLKRQLAAKGRKWDQNKKAAPLGTTKNVRKTRKSILSTGR